METTTPAFVELSASSTLNRYTEEERRNHCKEWQKSGLSMSEYCRRNGIAISSLSKWSHEPKKLSVLPEEKREIPVTTVSHDAVEIILVSGLRLRLARLTLTELLKLIRALESCS